MTDYAGEILRITVTAEDFTSAAITPEMIAGMYVTIYSGAGATVVEETAMTYSEDESLWYYLWDTRTGVTPTPLAAGTYRVKCTLVDLNDDSSWEYKRVRLSKNPV